MGVPDVTDAQHHKRLRDVELGLRAGTDRRISRILLQQGAAGRVLSHHRDRLLSEPVRRALPRASHVLSHVPAAQGPNYVRLHPSEGQHHEGFQD